jgi:hypothetical protein
MKVKESTRSAVVAASLLSVSLLFSSRPAVAQSAAAPAAPPPATGSSGTPSPYLPNLGGTSTTYQPGKNKSENMKLLSHVPLGAVFTIADIEIEQELSRPYAYVARRLVPSGFDVIDLKDPSKAKVIYRWRIENAELHQGAGGLESRYFKMGNKYYFVLAVQFRQGGPDADLGAIVFDVTGLPNPALVKEVGRIREKEFIGGFHEHFLYRHSDGRVLLTTTTTGPFANMYDMAKFLAGDPNQGFVGRIPIPQGMSPIPNFPMLGYHDFYMAYDPVTHQDKFYGAGIGGYHIYDISKPEAPQIVTSVTGVQGVQWGHTIAADPLGRFALTETEYQYAPLRMFDLKPKGDGTNFQGNISRSIGAWTANWQNLAHNFEMRWPYVFVSAYEDGLQVINMMDPTNPITVGYYDTYDGPHNSWAGNVMQGAWGVDVRNADGLIVISDLQTGFWAFKMEGFDGWNGHDWGMPNISSAQDYDNGPEGAPKGGKPIT